MHFAKLTVTHSVVKIKIMETIENGDYVRHIDASVNDSEQMTVVEVDNTQVKCSHGTDLIPQETWYNTDDLVLIHKNMGGFMSGI